MFMEKTIIFSKSTFSFKLICWLVFELSCTPFPKTWFWKKPVESFKYRKIKKKTLSNIIWRLGLLIFWSTVSGPFIKPSASSNHSDCSNYCLLWHWTLIFMSRACRIFRAPEKTIVEESNGDISTSFNNFCVGVQMFWTQFANRTVETFIAILCMDTQVSIRQISSCQILING